MEFITSICETCNINFLQVSNTNTFKTCYNCNKNVKILVKNNDDFIIKIVYMYNKIFDFTKTKYNGAKNNIIITCLKCNNDINRLPSNFKNNAVLCECYNIKKIPYTIEDINKIKNQFGEYAFDYDNWKIITENNKNYISLTCTNCKKEHIKTPYKYSRMIKSCMCLNNLNCYNDFKNKSIEINNDKFTYYDDENKDLIFSYKTKYKLKCNKCDNIFTQDVGNHIIKQQGCKQCALDINSLNGNELIICLNEIYNGKYEYLEIDLDKIYKTRDFINIYCSKHKYTWSSTVNSHKLQNKGCYHCGYESNRYTHDEFINKLLEKHGDKYYLDEIEYTKHNEDVILTCKAYNHRFLQKPYNILRGYGCKQCTIISQTKTTKEFIKQAKNIHNNSYDYIFTNYKNALSKIVITCKIHGNFEQRASEHLSGAGCKKCADVAQSLTKEEFIEKANNIHGNRYDYSLVDYKNNRIKITIICNIHGEFKQKPDNHICKHNKNGCPFCFNKTEYKIYKFLKYNFSCDTNIIHQFKTDFCKNKRKLPYDFCLEKFKIIIELDGCQHFKQISNWKCPKETQKVDFYKRKVANDNGYKIIRLLQKDVWFGNYDWENVLYIYIDKLADEEKITNVYLTSDSTLYDNYLKDDSEYGEIGCIE